MLNYSGVVYRSTTPFYFCLRLFPSRCCRRGALGTNSSLRVAARFKARFSTGKIRRKGICPTTPTDGGKVKGYIPWIRDKRDRKTTLFWKNLLSILIFPVMYSVPPNSMPIVEAEFLRFLIRQIRLTLSFCLCRKKAPKKDTPRGIKLRRRAGKSGSGVTRYEAWSGFRVCNRTYTLCRISRKVKIALKCAGKTKKGKGKSVFCILFFPRLYAASLLSKTDQKRHCLTTSETRRSLAFPVLRSFFSFKRHQSGAVFLSPLSFSCEKERGILHIFSAERLTIDLKGFTIVKNGKRGNK